MKKELLYLACAIFFNSTAITATEIEDECPIKSNMSQFNFSADEIKDIKNNPNLCATLADTNASTAIARLNGSTSAILFDPEITMVLAKLGALATTTGTVPNYSSTYFDLPYLNQSVSQTFTGTSFSNTVSNAASPIISVTINGAIYQHTATGAAIPQNSMIIFRNGINSPNIFSLRVPNGIAQASSGAIQATSIVSALNSFFPHNSTIIGNTLTISSAIDTMLASEGVQTNTIVSGVFTNGAFTSPRLSNLTVPTTFSGTSFTSTGNTISVSIGGENFTYSVASGASSSTIPAGSVLVFNNTGQNKRFTITTSSLFPITSSDASRAKDLTAALNDYFYAGSTISASGARASSQIAQLSSSPYFSTQSVSAVNSFISNKLDDSNNPTDDKLNQIMSMLGATQTSGTSGSVFDSIYLSIVGANETFTGSSFEQSSSGNSEIVTVTIDGNVYTYTETMTGETPALSTLSFVSQDGGYMSLRTTSAIGTSSDTAEQKATAIALALNAFFPNNSVILANEGTVQDAISSSSALVNEGQQLSNSHSLYDVINTELTKIIGNNSLPTEISQPLTGVIFENPLLNQPTSNNTTFSYGSFWPTQSSIAVTIDGNVYSYSPSSGTVSQGNIVFSGSNGKTLTISNTSYNESSVPALLLQMSADLNTAFDGVTIHRSPVTIENSISAINKIILGGPTSISGTSTSTPTTFSDVSYTDSLSTAFTFNGSSFSNTGAHVTIEINGETLTYTETATDTTTSGSKIVFNASNGKTLSLTLSGNDLGEAGHTSSEKAAAITTALNAYFINGATLSSDGSAVDLTTGSKFSSNSAIQNFNSSTSIYDKETAFLNLFNALNSGEEVNFKKPAQNISTFTELLACFR